MQAKRPEKNSCKPKLKKKILAEGELIFKVRGEEFNVKSKKKPSSAELREILTESEIFDSPTPP